MENTFYMLLHRAFHAQRGYLRSFLGESGLGTGQPKLLVHLERQGPCSQRELAEYFEIDPAAVSRMLCALEKSGFVTRKAHPESRRKDLVELTEQGHTMAKIWRGNYQKMEEIMLKGFPTRSGRNLPITSFERIITSERERRNRYARYEAVAEVFRALSEGHAHRRAADLCGDLF